MSATAEDLFAQSAPASRNVLAPRSRKPRRRAYRRGEFAKPHFVELDPPIESQSPEAKFWARYAIPAGMAAFWIVFVASNWGALRTLLLG